MGKSAPTPDNSAVIAAQASQAAADKNYQLGEDQLQWAQTQWNQEQPLVDQVTNAEANAETSATNFSNEQQSLYTGTTAPAIQNYTNEAENYATPGQLAVNAGAATGQVADTMASEKASAQQQLESYGVDPTSTRYAGLDYGYNASTGAAEAGAGTTAIQNTKLQGLGLQANAVAMGQGLPGNSASLTGAATGSGSASTGATANNLTAGSNATTATTAFTNAGTNAMNTDVSAVNSFNTAEEQGYQASQTGAAGLGSAIGGLAGLAAFKLADGGAVPTPGGGIPMPSGATPGGSVPAHASPSGGTQTDDVPANLTAGEFVMPKDIVNWIGQKALIGQIDKARQEQQQLAQRKDIGGEPAQAIPMRPTFVSRPQPQQRQAIPA